MKSHWLVEINANGVFVLTDGGEMVILRKDQEPVRSLDAGYHPHTFFTGMSVNVFEQVHSAGHSKFELYSKEFGFLGDHIKDLTEDMQTRLKKDLSTEFTRMWGVMVGEGLYSDDDPYLSFERLTIGTRVGLLSFYDIDETSLVGNVAFLEDFDKSTAILSCHIGISESFDVEKCKTIFEKSFVDVSRRGCQDGHLSFPSPFGGKEMVSESSICCSEVIYWYPCIDKFSGESCYVIASMFHCEIIGLYVPHVSLLVGRSRTTFTLITDMFGASLPILLMRHLAVYAPMIRDYVGAQSRALALIYGEEHLGHHIWNELSGLNAFLDYPKPTNIPLVIEMSANSEMFGRLDELFPELAGRVERVTGPREALLASIYERRLLVVRPTSLFVPASLRRRISKLIPKQAYLSQERGRLSKIQEMGSSIICLQLRSENRTFTEPTRFFIECMSEIVEQLGRVCFVIDGHSTSMQTEVEIRSFKQATSSRPVIEVQNAVAVELEQHARAIGADFVSNIGKPIGASLFWITASDFFIAPWGAGMVKTRWATSRPGLMLTNTWNLTNHHDLRLYDSPMLNEDPKSLIIASELMIIDRPDAPVLISGVLPSSMNFDVAFDLFRELLIEACQRFSIPSFDRGRSQPIEGE